MDATRRDVLVRVVKYVFEGLAVAVVALLLGGLTSGQIVAVSTTAAAAFAVLDLLLPAVCVSASSAHGSRERGAAAGHEL